MYFLSYKFIHIPRMRDYPNNNPNITKGNLLYIKFPYLLTVCYVSNDIEEVESQ